MSATLNQALKVENLQEAMKEELKAIDMNQTWELTNN